MRLTDYVATLGYDEIDCSQVSSGWWRRLHLWLSVMDDNINKTIVSGFLHSFKDTLIYNNRCGCNFVPDMWKYVDMGDILALDATRKFTLKQEIKMGLMAKEVQKEFMSKQGLQINVLIYLIKKFS